MLGVISQQVNVVNTHLHSLELVRQGQGAKLPDSEELTADAVKAEEFLAQLQAESEIAGSVANIGTSGLSDEEQALFEELERESEADKGGVAGTTQVKLDTVETPEEREEERAEDAPANPVAEHERPAAAPREPDPRQTERTRTRITTRQSAIRNSMALIDKIFGRKKTLSDLNKQELRKEEILIGKQRDRLFKRIEEIAVAKQKIFQQDATQKSRTSARPSPSSSSSRARNRSWSPAS